ncbi:DUF418 domain-containing protein [Deinococcus ficus]|uniref:DUF418 domain-containing protein n=1 Tax=Deinococcus ficus TaxID=317577 RepID=A0A221T0K6_9DEIO|nr:DUF418 domain-containing protein [Deinococcus ficus]ASN82433.1 hypothetical protein DFI_14710 [Deinococcus ficus]
MTGADRLHVIDALRGLALLGILLVNILVFATPYYATGLPDPAVRGPLDQALYALITLLFETKFYLLFSFLFGYSFTLQMTAATRAGASFRPRMLRRLLGLAVIGVLHALLLYHGDILTIYALLGVILVLAEHWDARRATRVALILLGVNALVWFVLSGLAFAEPTAFATDAAAELRHVRQALTGFTGLPGEVVAEHARQYRSTWPVLMALQGVSALAAFLLGFAAGKLDVFQSLERAQPVLGKMLRLGLPVGVLGAMVYTGTVHLNVSEPVKVLGFALDTFTAPFLTAAYVALFTLTWPRHAGKLYWLVPAGRLALSNYLGQSLMCSLIFHGYGLKLMGQVSLLEIAGIALALFAVQVWFSHRWLSRFQYGPAEWVLRGVTTLSVPRLKCTEVLSPRKPGRAA